MMRMVEAYVVGLMMGSLCTAPNLSTCKKKPKRLEMKDSIARMHGETCACNNDFSFEGIQIQLYFISISH